MFFWQDIIEISFFSILFYQLILWLSEDKSKLLLLYFLTYSFFFIISYSLAFNSITSFFISYTPAVIMIFILMHEKTLQRNYITGLHQTLKKENTSHWIDTIIRVALQTIHSKKNITFLIEQQHDISSYLLYPFLINTDIQEKLLTALIQSNTYQEESIIWVNKEGNLKSINCTWKEQQYDNDFISLFTLSTDIIIITANIHTSLFSLTIDGIKKENIKPEQIIYFLKKELQKTDKRIWSYNNEKIKNTSTHL